MKQACGFFRIPSVYMVLFSSYHLQTENIKLEKHDLVDRPSLISHLTTVKLFVIDSKVFSFSINTLSTLLQSPWRNQTPVVYVHWYYNAWGETAKTKIFNPTPNKMATHTTERRLCDWQRLLYFMKTSIFIGFMSCEVGLFMISWPQFSRTDSAVV